MYKTCNDLGIKKIRDIYDYNEKVFCSFGKLRDLYNIPSHDFLRSLLLSLETSNGILSVA